MENRIKELENALRESVVVAADRENEYFVQEEKHIELNEKLKKLEHRNLSLQTANILRCNSCRQFKNKITHLKENVDILLDERRSKLKELTNLR